MRYVLKTLLLIWLLLGSQGEGKVTKERFNKLILGRWELVEVTVDGFKRSTNRLVYEYQAEELIVNDDRGRRVFGSWKFYEKQQIMILKDMSNGGLWAQQIHYATADSLSYEYVSINGIRSEKWLKLNDKSSDDNK